MSLFPKKWSISLRNRETCLNKKNKKKKQKNVSKCLTTLYGLFKMTCKCLMILRVSTNHRFGRFLLGKMFL